MYKFSKEAAADIREIYAQGIRRFGERQAERYGVSLGLCFENLAAQPRIGRERTEFRRPVRVHFHQMHVVAFVVQDEDILIIRVFNGRQDWGSLL